MGLVDGLVYKVTLHFGRDFPVGTGARASCRGIQCILSLIF